MVCPGLAGLSGSSWRLRTATAEDAVPAEDARHTQNIFNASAYMAYGRHVIRESNRLRVSGCIHHVLGTSPASSFWT